MVSVILKDCGEPKVVQLTFENLYTELKDIPGSELLVKDSWNAADVKNRFVCFVEADCLLSEGYFKKQLEAFRGLSPRVVALAPSVAVSYWDNKFYGYYLGLEGTIPNRRQKGNNPHPLQVAYIPGTLIRTSSLKKLLPKLAASEETDDLVYYSTRLSMGFWEKGITLDDKHPEGQLGTQIYINPAVTYLSTEDYINDIADYPQAITGDLLTLFERESI